MGLVDLKTNLKSLKYGQETPLVTKDINNPPSNNTLSMEVTRRVDDTVRIVKLLATKPGLSWIAKQGALEIVQQSIHSDGKEELLKRLAEAGLNTAKVIGSTIAQVPVNGTGTHFVRGFGEKRGYLGKSGAMLAKDGAPIIQDSTPINLNQAPFASDILARQGEGLVNGITQADDTQQRSKLAFYTPELSDNANLLSDVTLGEGSTKLIDYRNLNGLNYATNTYKFDYSSPKIKKESRVNLGDQGKRNSRINYTDTSEDLSDGINRLAPTQGGVNGTTTGRDMVKFRFHILTPETGGSTQETALYFRAFLDSLSDNFTGDWTAHKYIGRAENFYTYGGFDRDISLSFKIAAATRQEMDPLYQKIVMLASATAPTYDDGNFMKGTVVGLTVGDYLDKVYGILTSVNYSWQTEYPWEISMSNPEGNIDDDQQELPMVLDCSVQFRPIHNFIPQTGLYNYITSDKTGKAWFRNGRPVEKAIQAQSQGGTFNDINAPLL